MIFCCMYHKLDAMNAHTQSKKHKQLTIYVYITEKWQKKTAKNSNNDIYCPMLFLFIIFIDSLHFFLSTHHSHTHSNIHRKCVVYTLSNMICLFFLLLILILHIFFVLSCLFYCLRFVVNIFSCLYFFFRAI